MAVLFLRFESSTNLLDAKLYYIYNTVETEVMCLIDFSMLKLHNREPVYLQIVSHVKRCILTREARNGDALPSRREIAALIGINPNTVQKAFKIMEDEGFVVTPRNAASVLHITPELLSRIEMELSHAFVRNFTKRARENGLSYKRVIELISQYWEENV